MYAAPLSVVIFFFFFSFLVYNVFLFFFLTLVKLQFKDMAVLPFCTRFFFTLRELVWVCYLYLLKCRSELFLLQYADLNLFTFNTTFDVCLVFLIRMHKLQLLQLNSWLWIVDCVICMILFFFLNLQDVSFLCDRNNCCVFHFLNSKSKKVL